MAKSKAGEVALEFLRKESSRNLPSLAIARLLCKEHPLLFCSEDNARAMVRRYRGSMGEDSKRLADMHGTRREHGTCLDGINQLPKPLGDACTWRPIPIECKDALIINDIHIPFHDPQALDIALKEGKRRGVDCIVLNGDIIDFHAISFFDRDPRLRDISAELQATELFLEHLRDRFPKARIVYKPGNHEERLPRWVWTHVPEFAKLKCLTLPELLNMGQYGIEYRGENKEPLLLGPHLYVFHGHEFRVVLDRSVNPARGLYMRAKCNAICGDVHQSANHTEPSFCNVVSTWSIGALCRMHPQWLPINRWNLGFALVSCHGDAWSVDNRKIIGGRVV